jgi:hypothetical protein
VACRRSSLTQSHAQLGQFELQGLLSPRPRLPSEFCRPWLVSCTSDISSSGASMFRHPMIAIGTLGTRSDAEHMTFTRRAKAKNVTCLLPMLVNSRN